MKFSKKCLVLIFAAIFAINNLLAQAVLNEVGEDISGSVQMAMSNHEYLVTAGDIYSLSFVANGHPVSYTIPVDPSYKIRVANLAVLDAKGKTFITLKSQVEEIVQKNYPMSGVQFILLNPANFKVVIKGEVKSTSERRAWPLTRLNSILKEDNFTDFASRRTVEITSIDGKTTQYDLYESRRNGDLSQNPFLRPGDIITIKRAGRQVSIYGGVERPGHYELLEGENLKDLVYKYANGFTEFADLNCIEFTRLHNEEEAKDSIIGQKKYITKAEIDNNMELRNRDTVYISSLRDIRRVMFVEGAIYVADGKIDGSNRSSFAYDTGTNYGFFIRSHSGLFDSSSADREHAYIRRGDKEIPINLNEFLYDESYFSEYTIEPYDVLVVPFLQYFVSVAGSVYKPGRYPYIPDRSYDYYVGLAGGFKITENSGRAVDIRDSKGRKHKKSDIIGPEYTITAKTNSFTFKVNQFSGLLSVLATLFSVIGSALGLIVVFNK